jgi:hypothetical protein
MGKIKDICEQKGITIKDVAAGTEYHENVILGIDQIPRDYVFDYVDKVAKYLGVTYEHLTGKSRFEVCKGYSDKCPTNCQYAIIHLRCYILSHWCEINKCHFSCHQEDAPQNTKEAVENIA